MRGRRKLPEPFSRPPNERLKPLLRMVHHSHVERGHTIEQIHGEDKSQRFFRTFHALHFYRYFSCTECVSDLYISIYTTCSGQPLEIAALFLPLPRSSASDSLISDDSSAWMIYVPGWVLSPIPCLLRKSARRVNGQSGDKCKQ